MTKISRLFKRIVYITASTVLALSSLVALLPQGASAAQVTVRSVQMSSSSNAGSAASTTYNVNATVATTMASLKGIVLTFCTNSPIIGDTTCTAPTGFTIGGSPSVTTGGVLTASGWTAASTLGVNTLFLTNATGVATTAGSSVITFAINNVQNPTSAPATFYARMYTYSTTTGATGYTLANPDVNTVHTDDGGFAMATANQVTVTAKVQETLLFCVYTTGANCAGGTVAGMVLGDSFGVLSSTTTAYLTSTNATTPLTAKLGLASNATSGVSVRAKTATLTSGSNTITATGSGSGTCTADSSTATVEQYGFRIVAGASQTDVGYGTVAGCTSTTIHAFNTTNLASTYGDQILTTAGPTTEAAATVDFVGKSSTTTKSGVYTSTVTFIATGTY